MIEIGSSDDDDVAYTSEYVPANVTVKTETSDISCGDGDGVPSNVVGDPRDAEVMHLYFT